MIKRVLSVLLSAAIVASTCLCFSISASATSYADQLRNLGFPESYINSIVDLHSKYPNWTFKPFKTGLDWQNAINGERSTHSKQVISKSTAPNDGYFCKCSKCYKDGSYVSHEYGLYSASEAAVKYYMDPRNWLNTENVFQFESSKYSSKQTISGIEATLKGTFMYKANIQYKNASGKTVYYKDSSGNKMTYSSAILAAAKNSGLNAYYIGSKIVQEIGSTKQNVGGTCGTREPFKAIYNYYSIGASGGASDGLHWAGGKMWATRDTILYSDYDSSTKKVSGTKTKVALHHYMSYLGTYGSYIKVKLYSKTSGGYTTDGKVGYVLKSDSDYSSLSYGRPWNNPYKSIYYGAQFIADGYLEYQYTPYLQKFNVNTSSPETYAHEYLTNVNGAVSASAISYKAYKDADMLSLARTFYIPVFKNMPSKKSPAPKASTTTTNPTTPITPTVTKPAKVTNLALSSRGTETLKIKWTSVKGADSYDVYMKSVRTGAVYHKTVSTNSATLCNLTPANAYNIKVRAYNSKYGDYSALLVGITKPEKPPIKTPATNTKHQIIVKWSAVSCSGYKVQFSKKSDFSTIIATKKASSSATSYTGNNFTKGRTYYVRVRAYKTINGKTVYSSWSSVKKIVSK